MLYVILIVAWAWFMIGLIHAMIWDAEIAKQLIRDHRAYVYVAHHNVITVYYPHDDVRALQRRNFVLTTILGPLGTIFIGADWLARNWPEYLVLGGTPQKPTPVAMISAATDAVDLEPYRQKAGIFNNR